MNWCRLYLQKETIQTTAFRKAEWAATLVIAEDPRLDGALPGPGERTTKLGTGRVELESTGAFAPEARGEMRFATKEFDIWSEFSNDRAALGSGEGDTLRIRFDEPSIVVEGQPVITFEKPKGKTPTLLLGATMGESFLGYLPVALKAGGTLAFLFGSSALMPWFLPAAQPIGGQKLIEAPRVPQELIRNLGREELWKALEEKAGKFFEPMLAARAMYSALQYVRYG